MPAPRRSAEPDPRWSPTPASHDRELVARIRAGDDRALETIFKAYYDRLCRYVAGYLGSRDAAEDVVQGVFVRVWEERAHWDVQGSVQAYLYGAARRRAVSYLRHRAVRRRTAPALVLETAAQVDAPSTEAAFEAEELRARLERALATLPPRTREAFVLSRGEGLSYDEVALRMGISPKTVGVHIAKSLAALRRAMLALSWIAPALLRLR